MSHPTIDFDQMIAPLTRAQFLAEYWTRKFLHVPGAKGRFTPILPWEELNHILEWHPPPQPQLRMFQDGVMVDLRRYIDGQVGALRLNAGGLIALLGQGATMVLDSLQDVSPAVAHLTQSVETTLNCACVTNLYAGWRTQNGFKVHWDAQEVFVLQLAGRKRWQVFAPTRRNPLTDDSEPAQPPTVPPIWEGILNDGDLLYIPRGFWHVATPLEEASLHVSVSAQPATGVDFLAWWMRTLRAHPEARASLTQMDDPAARAAFVTQMVKLIAAAGDGDPLGKFLGGQKASRRARPRIRLPLAPHEQARPLTLATRIRLASQDSLHVEKEPGEPMAKFFAAGTYWFIQPEFMAAFRRLSGHESVAIHDLAATLPNPQLIGLLAGALETMANAGLILKEEAGR